MRKHIIPKLIGFIRWFEKYSRRRAAFLLNSAVGVRIFGLSVIIFSAAGLVSPPFSGLDTLPSMGVVIISLSVILEDFLLYLFGMVVGLVGIGLIISLGTAAYKLTEGLF